MDCGLKNTVLPLLPRMWSVDPEHWPVGACKKRITSHLLNQNLHFNQTSGCSLWTSMRHESCAQQRKETMLGTDKVFLLRAEILRQGWSVFQNTRIQASRLQLQCLQGYPRQLCQKLKINEQNLPELLSPTLFKNHWSACFNENHVPIYYKGSGNMERCYFSFHCG